MDDRWPHRPRVSRETRLLLTTAFIAFAALLALARVRYPDRPATPNPVQPLLTQIAPRPTFDGLATEISQLQPRLEPLVIPFDAAHGVVPALRIGGDMAVTLLGAGGAGERELSEQFVRIDPASRLALLQVPGPPAPPPVSWSPAQTGRPRYLIASDASTSALSWRPVFVGTFAPADSPVWRGRIWAVPVQPDLVPGSFVFTPDALLAGLVVEDAGRRAIVPADVLLAEAARLLVPRVSPAGYLGVQVQQLTPPIAKATGASSGVVVTHVDAAGPAAGIVAAGDVLEAADGDGLPTPAHWNTRVARLVAGEMLTLRVRRGGQSQEVALAATGPLTPAASRALGLTLRPVAGMGAAVVRVDPGSTADRAGLLAGDLITRLADRDAPSPRQVRSEFAAAAEGEALLVALTRGESHHVTALEK